MTRYYKIPTDAEVQKREQTVQKIHMEKVDPVHLAAFRQSVQQLSTEIQKAMLCITTVHEEPLQVALTHRLDQSRLHEYFQELYGALLGIYQDKVSYVMHQKYLQAKSGGPLLLERAWNLMQQDLSSIERLGKKDYVLEELYKVIMGYLYFLGELDLFYVHKVSFIEPNGLVRYAATSPYHKLRSSSITQADAKFLHMFFDEDADQNPITTLLTILSVFSYARHGLLANEKQKECARANILRIMSVGVEQEQNSSATAALRSLSYVEQVIRKTPVSTQAFFTESTPARAKKLHEELLAMKSDLNSMSYLSDEDLTSLVDQVPFLNVGYYHIQAASFSRDNTHLAKVEIIGAKDMYLTLEVLSDTPDFSIVQLPHLSLVDFLTKYGMEQEIAVLQCMVFSQLIAFVQQYRKNKLTQIKKKQEHSASVKKSYEHYLSGIHSSLHEQLLTAMEQIEAGDLKNLHVKKLRAAEKHYRVRVRSVRIIFKKEGDSFIITQVGERGRVYGDF